MDIHLEELREVIDRKRVIWLDEQEGIEVFVEYILKVQIQ